LLSGFFGYREAPALGEVIAYFGRFLPTLFLFFSGGNKVPGQQIEREMQPSILIDFSQSSTGVPPMNRVFIRKNSFVAAACFLALSVSACTASSQPPLANIAGADAPQSSSAPSPIAQSAGAAAAKVDPAELQKAMAQYKTYVNQEIEQLADKTKVFTNAVIAGDIKKAKRIYAPTRVHWERTEPIAELFSDLDGSMDAREDDFAKKAEDPGFTGFHRLEKALFKDNSTKGMKPIAERLMKDTLTLKSQIAKLTIEPKDMVGGAAALIEEVAATKVTGEEERYSRTDLWDFKANLEGSEKIVALLNPMVEKADPALNAKIDKGFNQINQILAKYKTLDGGFASYDEVSEKDRQTLKPLLATHAEDLSQLRGTLGIN
jgi:iron uptake system component EfeO